MQKETSNEFDCNRVFTKNAYMYTMVLKKSLKYFDKILALTIAGNTLYTVFVKPTVFVV